MTGQSADGGPVTDTVRELIEAQRLCYVATICPDGHPNVSPKGSLKVLSSRQLAFANMASPTTLANLRHEPRLEINVVDPFRRWGYRIKGVAEITHDEHVMATVGAGLGHDYTVHDAVRITVTDVARVDSPVYLFTDASESEVHAVWEQVYGYQRDGAEASGGRND